MKTNWQNIDPATKEDALRKLKGMPVASLHIDTISLCLFDEHSSVRSAAQDTIRGTGEDVTSIVVQHLSGSDPVVRAAACEMLGTCGEAGVPYLAKVAGLLADPDWR